MLSVGEMMGPIPRTAKPDEPILDIAKRMVEERVGALIVEEDACCVGIITDRDLLSVVAEDSLRGFTGAVSDHMTPSPMTVRPEDSYATACHKIARGGYRHLPVVDYDGKPIGMLSVKDLVIIQSLFVENMVEQHLLPPADRANLNGVLGVVHLTGMGGSKLSPCMDELGLFVHEVFDVEAVWTVLESEPMALLLIDESCWGAPAVKLIQTLKESEAHRHVHIVVEAPVDSEDPVSDLADDVISVQQSAGEITSHLRLGYRLGSIQYKVQAMELEKNKLK